MRILQLIDTLDAGGAERMAVNFANALCSKIEFSALISTRFEGVLKTQLKDQVNYLYLNKKNSFDLKAILRLKKYIKIRKINIIHAHGPSFFMAFLVKIIHPKIAIIWHEHYGERVLQHRYNNIPLLFCSCFFSKIIVVNPDLKKWVLKNLPNKKVHFLPNFILENSQPKSTFLKGDQNKRIICLANLKDPKNHLMQLIGFYNLNLHKIGWSLHFIGKDFKDHYSNSLKDYIIKRNLSNAVFLYDTKNDVHHLLSQATIGLLTSTSEGFPVCLIEYGMAKLAVLSTNVGFCNQLIQNQNTGLTFDPNNQIQFEIQLQKYISDPNLRNQTANKLFQSITQNYNPDTILEKLILIYKTNY